jgi:outer membrane protein OmpA-like peptidoglycan-associated protein
MTEGDTDMRIASLILAAAVAMALQPRPAAAQSEEDLLKRFEQHRSTHRGLSLAPVTSAGTTTATTGATAGAEQGGTETGASVASTGGEQAGGAASVSGAAASPSAETAGETRVEYVAMPEDSQVNIRIEFDFDSAVLRPSETAKLETLCSAMQRSDVRLFHIFGHTDAAGSDAYNLNLSKLRAQEVRRHLIEDCGIAPDRLRAIGVGEQYPLDPQDARAPENRRVEFQAIG